MIVGYSEDHPRDTYRLYILDTRRVVIARDVQWLNWKYKESDITPNDNLGVDIQYWIENEENTDETPLNISLRT